MVRFRPPFVAACLGMLVFGIVMTVLGSLLPSFIEQFGIDKTEAGSLFFLMSMGILVASAFFGPIVDRFGYKVLLTGCVLIVALGLEAIAVADSFWMLRVAALAIGLAGGAVNGATNALVSDLSTGERSADLSILGIFFGLGAFGVPFLLGALLGKLSYGVLIAATGALVVLVVIFMSGTRFPAAKQPQGFPLARARDMLRDPLLLTFGVMLFLQSGMEISTGGWSAAFLNEELAVAGDRSVLLLSLFWVGMVLARTVLGALLRRVESYLALFASMALALLGALFLLLTSSSAVAATGLFLLGFGLAAGFPVVLGYVGDRYADVSGTAFSVVFVMALLGGSLLPYLMGVLGDAFGLRSSFLILPVALILLALLLSVQVRAMGRTGE